MRMNKWMETLLAAMMALGPTIIAVTMMQHYGPLGIACSLIFSGIYMLVLVLALTLRNCLRQRNSQPDQEQLQNADEDDSPPSYEVVTSKPPPYSLLFASAPPTFDVTSCPIPSAGPGYVAPVHSLPHDLHSHQHNKGVLHCYTWIVMNPETSPPSYFEAVSRNSPHSSEATSPGSLPSGDTPPSPSPIGATPPASPLRNTTASLLHPGTTPSSPPLNSAAHICDPPACTINSSPTDTRHFPT